MTPAVIFVHGLGLTGDVWTPQQNKGFWGEPRGIDGTLRHPPIGGGGSRIARLCRAILNL